MLNLNMPTKLSDFDLQIAVERFPIRGGFAISRGSKKEAVVVTAQLQMNSIVGRGECVPYARYGESVESVAALLEEKKAQLQKIRDPRELMLLLPAGAARNAVDSALWDWLSKSQGRRAFELLGLPAPQSVVTAYTISLGSVDEMFRSTQAQAARPLLKIKLGTSDDHDRIRAVRSAAPNSRIVVDANEGWTEAILEAHLKTCLEQNVSLVEQPLPEGQDDCLRRVTHLVPICADESIHDGQELESLVGRYDAVNIKLDKTGGLTQAVEAFRKAKELKFKIMLGCMVGTSLGMAPAMLLASNADFVDLDGPLLLEADRKGGLTYEGSLVFPPEVDLWG